MLDDTRKDPATGLLHRRAFLQEVREGQARLPPHVRKGCLLILHFPVLQRISDDAGPEAASAALCELLAIVETRVRSRDTLGRIAPNSLCLLLRQCKDTDAVKIAEAYVALLRDATLTLNGKVVVMDLRYRLVSLDSPGRKLHPGMSGGINAADFHRTVTRIERSAVMNSGVAPGSDVSSALVVTALPVTNTRAPGKSADAGGSSPNAASSTVVNLRRTTGPLHDQPAATSWRLKPGMLVDQQQEITCYRVQVFGKGHTCPSVESSELMNRVLSALSCDSATSTPAVQHQLIVPIEAPRLPVSAVQWLSDQCRIKRVSPADICLSLHVDSVSRQLRDSVPALRHLRRGGIRLMLEGINNSLQFKAMQNLVAFDYLHICSRLLIASQGSVRQRSELSDLICQAHEMHAEVSSAGVDSQALLEHARELDIDICFGRICGRSLAFPRD